MKNRQPVASGVILIATSLVLLFASSGCNGSIVAISAAIGSGGSSGGGNRDFPTLVSDVVISSNKTSPARIEFRLTDPESDPANVQLTFVPNGGGEPTELRLVADPKQDIDTNLDQLATFRFGVTHVKLWDFAREGQLETGDLMPGVIVAAKVRDGDSRIEIRASFGNDPPEIETRSNGLAVAIFPEIPRGDEAVGLVHVRFGVSDTSDDQVNVSVEYAIVDDLVIDGRLVGLPDDSDFRPATSAGQPLEKIQVGSTGTPVDFFWDVVFDVGNEDHEVLFRFTPEDLDPGDLNMVVSTGDSALTRSFPVDNNREPEVTLDTSFLFNPDERRRIPIPFTVSDDEGDEILIVFQWKRMSERDFPEILFDDPNRLRKQLKEPDFRREKHICTEVPLIFAGRVVPVDETTVRLPELAGSASRLVDLGSEMSQPRVRGELEILRSSGIPTPVAATWSTDPELREPIAVLPIGDGLKALVLERLGMRWRLREIELATGGNVIVVASGNGLPSAMTYESNETSVLIALVFPFGQQVSPRHTVGEMGIWQVRRVDLRKPGVENDGTELVMADGSTELGTIRGVASLGGDKSLITVGSSLIQLCYAEGQPRRAASLFGPPPLAPLQSPWGIAIDPLNTNRIYVAERDANCVLAIELDTLARQPVVADPNQGVVFRRPEGLALERSGTRLLVVTDSDPEDETRELTGVPIGRSPDLDGDGFGDQQPFEIQCGFSGEVGNVATGPDNLRVIALPDAGDLAVGGGVLQRRTLMEDPADYQPERQFVRVEAPFDPQLEVLQPWRVRSPTITELSASAEGTSRSFVWDSEDVFRGDFVDVRAIPFDRERGMQGDVGPKRVRSALDVEPLTFGDASTTVRPQSIAVADLDGDGDLDFVTANSGDNTLTVFFQENAGVFGPIPLVLRDSSMMRPISVVAADLNGDGDLDLVSANRLSNNLTVFFQKGRRDFNQKAMSLGDPNTTSDSRSVAAADLDGDGDLDLVSANRFSNLTVFFQESAGVFDQNALQLGGTIKDFEPQFVAAADLDGDGDLDLVSANGVNDNLTVFFQESTRVFAPNPLVLGGPLTTGDPRSVAAADLDGDGDLDLVSANRLSNNLTLFVQESAGDFSRNPLTLGGPLTTRGPRSVTAADLDGDGDLDLVSANRLNNNLTVFFQISPGDFDPNSLKLGDPNTTDFPRSVTAADLDGDGDLDLVSANQLSDNLTVFFQIRPGVFDPNSLKLGDSSTTDGPQFVAAADVDGDGDLDLVSANQLSDNLTVFFQIRPGEFDPNPLMLGDSSTTDGPQFVAAADLDGDGDLDLVSANQLSDNLTVFFQIRPGVFDPVPIVLGNSNTDGPQSVVAADVDGDGDLDLVSANQLSDNLTVFFQIRPGVFDPVPIVLGNSNTTNDPQSVVAADVDGDGDLDLVSANRFSDNLTVFSQIRPGVFNPNPLQLGDSSTTDGPVSVAVVDVDGDGDLDIVSANFDGNNLTVFFGGVDRQ